MATTDLKAVSAAAAAIGIELSPVGLGFYLGWQKGHARKAKPDVVHRCTCGKVRIQHVGSEGSTAGGFGHTECGCCDCRARATYAESLGGPKCPVIAEVSYWPNDIKVLTGKELLTAFRLQENAPVINIMTTCCHMVIMVYHPGFYDGKLFATPMGDSTTDEPTGQNLFENVIEWPPILMRLFGRDLTPKVLAAHPYSGIPGHDYTGDDPAFTVGGASFCMGLFKNFELTHRGQTFNELLADIGEVKIIGYSDKCKELSASGNGADNIWNVVVAPMIAAATAAAAAANAKDEGASA